MKNKVIKSPVFIIVAISALVFAVGFTFFSIASSLNSLSQDIEETPAEALLASTELAVNSLTSVPITYYSQTKDECVNLYDKSTKTALENRQFEWAECGYYNDAFEQNLVQNTLDASHLPVASNSGSLLPNRGITTNNFARWFNNKNSLSSTLALQYRSNTKTFSYESDNFYPIDSQLFTLNFEVPITAILSGDETFQITADDDTWVFLDDNLILDLGGIHGAKTASFSIHNDGKIFIAIDNEPEHDSGIQLSESQNIKARIFHANRNNSESIFKIKFVNMYLDIFNTEIAYSGDGSSYVPPLGESLVSEPNHSGAILTSIIAQFFILGILLILTPVIVSFAIRRRQK